MNIGERIAFYRRQKGLRQEDLARQVGVSAQAVQELLAQPPEEQIEKLCEIFWMLQKSLIETKEVQWLFNSLGFIPERYEAIFRALGTPHAMDILFLLYSHTSALSQEGLARRLNLSPGALTQPLAALVSLDLVNVIEIESEQGVSRCYQSVGSSIIMALYFIREWLAEKHINLASFYTRTKPLLAEPGA